MRSALILLVLFGMLVASTGIAIWAWLEAGKAAISFHGWIALGLGIGLTLLVGMGLMALVFYSNRSGHDERAHGLDRPAPRSEDEL